ncbi:MAG: hypothetical protein QW548_03280 [Candidatus Aenigmatarchaeota archaeon]
MVHVTSLMIALMLFVILLVVALLLLGGILPGFEQAFANATQTAVK